MADQTPGARRLSGLLGGWRGLGWFWVGVVALVGVGAGVLQVLGPPPLPLEVKLVGPMTHVGPTPGPIGPISAAPAPVGPAPVGAHPEAKANPAPHWVQPSAARPGRGLPGPITDPEPALLERAAGSPQTMLPRISADGRAPMAVYAAGFDPTNLRPRVGLLIAGIGMNSADSMAAIKTLPGGVTLAISAYAVDVAPLLAAARMTEHEYLLSLPMEPVGFPANDPDDRFALMTSLPPEQNLKRLSALLGRMTGYVGVTDGLGQLHGERLMGVPDQRGAVLAEVASRGLLFVDARVGQPVLPYAWNRSADLVIDAGSPDAATLDQRLDALTRMALEKRSVLGIVSLPRPVTVARIAVWANTLTAKGVALAPVSALMQSPAKQESDK